MLSPTHEALVAAIFFAVVGMFSWYQSGFWLESAPLFIYYAILIVNTFFSIRAFAAITPRNGIQRIFDAILVGIYVALASSSSSVTLFSTLSLLLFVVAIGKYMHLQLLIGKFIYVEKKIRINSLGVLLSAGCLAIAIMGFPTAAAWILAGIFAIANVYLLIINPMYEMREPIPKLR